MFPRTNDDFRKIAEKYFADYEARKHNYGQDEQAITYLDYAINTCHKIEKKELLPDDAVFLAICYQEKAKILYLKHKYPNAIANFIEALLSVKQIKETERSDIVYQLLIDVYHQLGKAYEKTWHLKYALDCTNESLRVSDHLSKKKNGETVGDFKEQIDLLTLKIENSRSLKDDSIKTPLEKSKPKTFYLKELQEKFSHEKTFLSSLESTKPIDPKRQARDKFDRHQKQLKIIASLHSQKLQLTKLEELLADGLDLKFQDLIGFTHLHWASYFNSSLVVKFLLEHGADPNCQTNTLITPLSCAVRSRNPATADIIKTLVDHGADINLNTRESTLIEQATDSGYGSSTDEKGRIYEVTKALVDCGIPPNALAASILDHPPTLNTPKLQLTEADQLLQDGINLKEVEMVEKALKLGADFNKPNEFGRSFYRIAVHMKDNLEIIRAIIEAGANVNDIGYGGFTPLHDAAYACDLSLINLLIELGANIDAPNKDGETPLHCICSNDSAKDDKQMMLAVAALVDQGADIDATDNSNNTPIRSAATNDHYDLVKFLVKIGADTKNKKSLPTPSFLSRGYDPISEVIAKAVQEVKQEQTAESSRKADFWNTRRFG